MWLQDLLRLSPCCLLCNGGRGELLSLWFAAGSGDGVNVFSSPALRHPGRVQGGGRGRGLGPAWKRPNELTGLGAWGSSEAATPQGRAPGEEADEDGGGSQGHCEQRTALTAWTYSGKVRQWPPGLSVDLVSC